MTQRYMLDTNVVSHVMQGRDVALLNRLTAVPIGQVVISSVTLAELEYGVNRRGRPQRLLDAMTQVLLYIDVLPWDEHVARRYGTFCAALESEGVNLSDLDMMIASHAVAEDAILVSRDKAFAKINHDLKLEVW